MSDKAVTDNVMSAVSYGGAGVSVVSGLTLTEWGIIVGIVTALLTFAANMVYQYRKDKREKALYELEKHRLELDE